MKKLKETNLPKAIKMVSDMNDPSSLALKTKLILPRPQITDAELQSISKMQGENKLGGGQEGSSATKALVGEYSQRDMMTPQVMRTPMLSSQNLIREAQDALALKNQQTPLIGGDNPSL